MLPLIWLVTVKYFSILRNFYVVENISNISLLLFCIYHHLKFSLICLWLNKHIFPNTKYLNELVIKLKFSKRVTMIINVRYVLLNFVPNFALYLHYFQNKILIILIPCPPPPPKNLKIISNVFCYKQNKSLFDKIF